jgi:hypothetical protein
MSKTFSFGLLGTSLSCGATRDNSYARDVIAMLSIGKTSLIDCYNMSVDGGSSLTGGLPNYAQVARLRPDAIILEYSMNDCVGTLADSQSRHASIIAGIRSISPATAIFLMTMNTLIGSSAPVAARSNLAAFYQLYRDMAPVQSVGLIDNTPNWAGATSTDLPDGLHPTVLAHRQRTVPGIVAALSPLVT